MDSGQDHIGVDAGTIGRRTLIKRAAAAGAVAWTAPMVLDSLSSPAAAGTLPHGCHVSYLNFDGCAWQGTNPNPAHVCAPSTSGCATSDTDLPDGVVSGSSCPSNNSQNAVTVTVGNDYSCTIIAVAVYLREDDGFFGSHPACRSTTSDGTVGYTTFSGLGTKAVTIAPGNGDILGYPKDRWAKSSLYPANSAIGVVVQCAD
jgi:hypothetical protein